MRTGARAEGHVTRKWVHDPDTGGKDYWIGYEFDLPTGQTIEGEREVTPTRFAALKKGDSIFVRYSRVKPSSNLPEGTSAASRNSTAFTSAISLFLALFGGVLVAKHWNRAPSRGAKRS